MRIFHRAVYCIMTDLVGWEPSGVDLFESCPGLFLCPCGDFCRSKKRNCVHSVTAGKGLRHGFSVLPPFRVYIVANGLDGNIGAAPLIDGSLPVSAGFGVMRRYLVLTCRAPHWQQKGPSGTSWPHLMQIMRSPSYRPSSCFSFSEHVDPSFHIGK